MKAVVMAGGEGTRLRPTTANQPKPLLPVVNKPIMEHVLRLLRRHGFGETVVTVQFLAALIRNYFGDGEELGMTLRYATEHTPLGTAGSVRNAAEVLAGEPFLVISGDALTDIDLTDMVKFHRQRGAAVTIGLKSVSDPLEFGIVITGADGRIERFLEKPTWGQVFSDTVNTGIYVMEPDVLCSVAAGEVVDWSADVFPALLAAGAPLYGYVTDGYWEDVGTHESYLRAQADVLNRKVDVDIDAFEVSPGVWIGEGAEVHPDAVLKGPLFIGDYAKVEAGAELREYTVLGNNVVVKGRAFLHRAVVSALTASAIDVQDLEVVPTPVARFETDRSEAVGGVVLRTTPGDSQCIDIAFLDAGGADISKGAQRKLERVFSRQEFRRAFPGEIAELSFPSRKLDGYVEAMLRSIDSRGLREARLKVVLDTAGGAAALVLPTLLGQLGVDVLTVNNRLDESAAAESLADRMRDLQRLGELVSSSRAAFGVRFDTVGERIAVVDERGELIEDGRALLVLLDLVAAERRGSRVALPITTTRVAERVSRFHACEVMWTSTSPDDLTAAGRQPGVAFAGDGAGGFVVPEFHAAIDGLAAFVRLCGLVARTKLTLSAIDSRIPQAHVLRRALPTPWAAKGLVMRSVIA